MIFATITNIVAYLPFLMVGGDTGALHLYCQSLACSLIASRIVSMTFIPLLGYYLLRPPKTGGAHRRAAPAHASWVFITSLGA
jgi:multidrug efflux pump subunit AcrB